MNIGYLSICLDFKKKISFNFLIVISVKVLSLAKFIPRYFILLNTTVNRIIFLISFMNYSLLVYKTQLILCVDLVSCSLSNLFIIHRGYWLIVFLSCDIFVWLWYQGNTGLIE